MALFCLHNCHFTTSQDGKTWTVVEPPPYMPNGLNSKPAFDKFGSVNYLGCQENPKNQNFNRSVFNVNISRGVKRRRIETLAPPLLSPRL